ncbi:MAG: hypothetical protein NC131_20355, partial [Roseburia sp.]|nr:hypothetical protein [Roseburia sp.]
MFTRIKTFVKIDTQNINSIILSVYLFAVGASYLFINYYEKVNNVSFFTYLVGILILVMLITSKVIDKLSTI